MKRREFVQAAGLGLAASAVASQALAQSVHCTASLADNGRGQAGDKATARLDAPKRVGFLLASTKRAWSDFLEEFRDALEDALPTTPFKIKFSPAANATKRNYPREAASLAVNPQIQIIVTAGSEPLWALIATGTKKPIVVASAGSTANIPPGVTVSGFGNGQVANGRDRFMKFKTYVGQGLATMAILYNKDARNAVAEKQEVVRAAGEGAVATRDLEVADGATAFDMVALIHALDSAVVKSLYVCTDPLLTMHRDAINTAAIQKQFPTMYQFRQHVEAGGLMSYGPDFTRLFRDAASLVGGFLGPDNQPVPALVEANSSQFELVWNRSTARILNLHSGTGYVPPDFLAQGGVVVD
jgi:putative ABC transport system substrate-binding protein